MNRHKLTIGPIGAALAHSAADLLESLDDPAPEAVTLFEDGPQHWRVEAYLPPDAEVAGVCGKLRTRLGEAGPEIAVAIVSEQNWVALSQAALPPVRAGRFIVYGSHDKERVARGPNAILIDAGEAFGTAHHATTYGCLRAVDRLARRSPHPRRLLDLGCGSGILAIAAARALPRATVLAVDSDAVAVRVAQENIRANGAAARVRPIVADGLGHSDLRRPEHFDLVLANILAAPLVALARGLARVLQPGGYIVLSGILVTQAPAVMAAYRTAGFALRDHHRVDGWSTLVFVRSGTRKQSTRRKAPRTG